LVRKNGNTEIEKKYKMLSSHNHLEGSSSYGQDLFFKRFVNLLMSEGKKSRAHRLVIDTLEELVKGGIEVNKLKHVLYQAIENMQPSFHLREFESEVEIKKCLRFYLFIDNKQCLSVGFLKEQMQKRGERQDTHFLST